MWCCGWKFLNGFESVAVENFLLWRSWVIMLACWWSIIDLSRVPRCDACALSAIVSKRASANAISLPTTNTSSYTPMVGSSRNSSRAIAWWRRAWQIPSFVLLALPFAHLICARVVRDVAHVRLFARLIMMCPHIYLCISKHIFVLMCLTHTPAHTHTHTHARHKCVCVCGKVCVCACKCVYIYELSLL